MGVLPVHMSVQHMHAVSREVRRDCEPPCGCWGLSLSPLVEEQCSLPLNHLSNPECLCYSLKNYEQEFPSRTGLTHLLSPTEHPDSSGHRGEADTTQHSHSSWEAYGEPVGSVGAIRKHGEGKTHACCHRAHNIVEYDRERVSPCV